MLLANSLSLELPSFGQMLEKLQFFKVTAQSTVLIPASIKLCLFMNNLSRCSRTHGLLFLTLMKGITLKSLLELPQSLKWFETGLSASESMSPPCCPSLTCILTWVLSRLQQIENRLGLAVDLVLNLDHLPWAVNSNLLDHFSWAVCEVSTSPALVSPRSPIQ